MTSKFGTWRQKIQQHLFVAIGILALLIALLTFFLAVHWWGWNWTGFGPYFSPRGTQYTDVPRGRTLWDWFELLIIPFMLVVGGFWLNQLQRTRDERAAEEHNKRASEIAAEKQKEAVLDAYLDRMSELLLEKKLRDSAEGDEVRRMARARTIMALRRLDGIRKAMVMRALHDDGLIDKDRSIISLNEAKLQGVQLHEANLSGANLSGADLFGADLSRADLSNVHLSGANLSRADLRHAQLQGANLDYAHLEGAILTRANPEEADCLKGAKMNSVIGLTPEQREMCIKKGAIFDDIQMVPAPAVSSPSSSTSEPSNSTQAPPAPFAQAKTPPPNTNGNGAPSSQQGPES